MKKFLEYSLGVFCLLKAAAVSAAERFEVLPDLPDPLSYAVQPVQGASVSGGADLSTLGTQSVGSEPNIISVLFSLFFVILLIYLTGIIYVKLNKAGFKTLKKQQGEYSRSHVSVISTTPLGNNKTLHVVELDGKRMLIGASSGAIQLIKDLGSPKHNTEDDEYSHIEIPNIKIPKIEIPKIEIPTINFSKMTTTAHKQIVDTEEENITSEQIQIENENVNKQENSDGIIDSLFTQQSDSHQEYEENQKSEHTVDPDDFALYKKYLS